MTILVRILALVRVGHDGRVCSVFEMMSCSLVTCRHRIQLNTCILRDALCEKADSHGIFVLADSGSKEASAWQSRVKARMCEEIDRMAQDVDEALRRMEEDVGMRGHEESGLVEKWEC